MFPALQYENRTEQTKDKKLTSQIIDNQGFI